MRDSGADVPEQVRQFAPKKHSPIAPKAEPPRGDGDLLDQSGEAILALLQHAATLSNETCDRADRLTGKLSLELHVAEDRINQLQAEIEQVQERAARAEKWLIHIYEEIKEKLLSRRAGSQQASRQ
jgi:hypothetical protein